MKKLLLSILLGLSAVCFASQPIDKAALQAIKNELIDVLKETEKEFAEIIAPFNEARIVPSKIMDELVSDKCVRAYLKSKSDCILNLIINEKKSFTEAMSEESSEQTFQLNEEAHKKFDQLCDTYFEDGPLLNAQFYLLNFYLDFTFGTIIVNNVLQEIEAMQ